MAGSEWLAERFEDHRAHLRAVAHRMLGSPSVADDAVQEAWLRITRSDASGVENLGGWLTTVVARVCLDMLRSRKSRREEPFEGPDPVAERAAESGPEREASLADSIGPAMLAVLETLAPAERVAFVLHDTFELSFDEIAPIVGRSPAAARQLASRARRRIRGTTVPAADPARRREVVEAFLAASRRGDFEALLAVLDPEVVLRADGAAVRMGAPSEIRGAVAVANNFKGRAQGARAALVAGAAGAVWAPGGRPRVAFVFSIENGRIAGIDLVADPARLGQLDLVLLEDASA